MKDKREIEKSIIKKFRKKIWSKFIKAIKEYKLINEFDKIAVCISGGKDSLLLAKCMEELHRYGQIKFDVEYILMDPGYSEENLILTKNNFEHLGLSVKIFKTNIFEIINKHMNNNPCYMCARMRRGHLYNYAKSIGCNKIALGHHFNDIIETIMLNILYTGQYKTMMPKIKSDNFSEMELIRPFYYVKENDIKAWVKYNDINPINCACSITREEIDSKRKEVKKLIEGLKKSNENVDISILRTSENIYLDSVISYYKNDKFTHFIDEYDSQNDNTML